MSASCDRHHDSKFYEHDSHAPRARHGGAAIGTLVLGSLLAACGGESDGPAPGGLIGETYVESLAEAEAVEDLLLEHKDRLDAALEDAASTD